ncbi:superoxide dismutase family protein [Lentibacillus sp. Marseille-P4043]|uniref:superoxide dismutase family protein n=1 Tax=Lentibacillus sp. Marseille-P4043 TaxID=2040293 RepID=UPI000D0B00A9|nr:superoxide dismutase family protein [Lentibacillus sp. Marseille-P4043]
MRFIVILLILFVSSCQGDDAETARSVDMYNKSGDLIGTAALTEQPDGVKVKLKLEGLTPGLHGIHVHEFPSCKGPDFKSAGNHYDPEGKEHGLMSPEGAHLGDMPNIEADADGLADAELMIAGATLLDGKKSLLKEDGTSIVIHKQQDDGVSQPSGDSGPRVACGEIKANPKAGKEKTPTDPTEFNEKQKDK